MISRKLYTRSNNVNLFSLFTLAIGWNIVYTKNIYNIQGWINNSNLFNRFSGAKILDDSRIEFKRAYIRNMLNYPFGGGELRKALGNIYAHDLYLDVYSDVGIIGYFLICLFMICSVIRLIKVIKNNRISNDLRLIIICVFLAILIEFMVEPIIIGVPWMLCIYCFLCGIIKPLKVISSEQKNIKYGD